MTETLTRSAEGVISAAMIFAKSACDLTDIECHFWRGGTSTAMRAMKPDRVSSTSFRPSVKT